MFESDDFDQVLSQYDFPEIQSYKTTTRGENDFSKVNNDASLQHSNIVDRNAECKTQESNLASNEILSEKSATRGKNCISNLNSDIALPLSDIADRNVRCKSPESNLATNRSTLQHTLETTTPIVTSLTSNTVTVNLPKDITPKQVKRKIINSHFDHKSKRKFPGPAGLLTGSLVENKDDNICHMELLSQDIEFSQNHLRGDLFNSPIWRRLLQDIKLWNLNDIDTIKSIKEQALAGHLLRRKAQTVIAFVETVDRSATDPLIIMRDSTGHIKGTLHRDAWSKLSNYIISEYCALVLWKPTVLTTGGAFKKHYLNITLSNIYAIYSNTIIVKEEDKHLPDGYMVVSEDDFTVIKTESTPQDLRTNSCTSIWPNEARDRGGVLVLDDLDHIFSDESF